ncbi:hypothetical protein ORJ04_19725, partial [Rheinheimera baltica]|nr:hypothetical protein [Rheinheimera baltica]
MYVIQTTTIATLAILLNLSGLANAAEKTRSADVVAPLAYRHMHEPIGTVRQIYDGKLYPDIQVNTFRNIDRLFPT